MMRNILSQIGKHNKQLTVFHIASKISHRSCIVGESKRIIPCLFSHNKILARPYCSHYDKIPTYIKEIANEFAEDDLRWDSQPDSENVETFGEEIYSYFMSKAIPYGDVGTSYNVECPSCAEKNPDQCLELSVDKKTGACICPWCYWEGNWGELTTLLDAKESWLSKDQLHKLLESASKIEDADQELFTSSSLQDIAIETLNDMNALLSEDKTQVIFRLCNKERDTVGFASVPLFAPKPSVIVRLLKDNGSVFMNVSRWKHRKSKDVIIVGNVLDAISLAKHNVTAICFCGDWSRMSVSWTLEYAKRVIFFTTRNLTQSIYSRLSCIGTKSYLLRKPLSKPIVSLKEKEVFEALQTAILYDDIEGISKGSQCLDKIRDLTNNIQRYQGIQWNRFKELNNILLGHRLGELTIVSGQTGTGKTTFCSEYSLDLAQQGVRTLWGSFEIHHEILIRTMLQQLCGHRIETEKQVLQAWSKFEELPLWFWTKIGTQSLDAVLQNMRKMCFREGVTHIIIDNLQFMMGVKDSNWWLEQDKVFAAFREFATDNDCHITLIVHPKKVAADQRLTLQDLSGGNKLSQEADNILLLQSITGGKSYSDVNMKTMEVAKNRYAGILDSIRLRFHSPSCTLSSHFHKSRISKPVQSNDESSNTPFTF